MNDWTLHHGNAVDVLDEMPAESVQTCITSPPYWQLRDYGVDGQLGLEETPDEYVEAIVEVFRSVRRVLRDDGTVWLNLGDTYAASGRGGGGSWIDKRKAWQQKKHQTGWRGCPDGLKPKDLVGIPWRVALALQHDGWWLRSDIVWNKTNPMPESVDDRPTRCHEYLFLLAKSERYYYDGDAIREPVTGGAHHRGSGLHPKCAPAGSGIKANESFSRAVRGLVKTRSKRTVWETAVARYAEAHFATFPPQLVEPCVLAGAPMGG